MTTTPPPIQPLTADELARLRQEHVPQQCRAHGHGGFLAPCPHQDCRWCRDIPSQHWPCTIARLLATVDAVRATTESNWGPKDDA